MSQPNVTVVPSADDQMFVSPNGIKLIVIQRPPESITREAVIMCEGGVIVKMPFDQFEKIKLGKHPLVESLGFIQLC